MNIMRVCKSLVSLSFAMLAFLACFNNLADYDSNYAFVQHVLSMDTVFSNNALKYRAILDPFIWSLAYGLIIFAEFLTGALLLIGAIGLLRNTHSPSGFNRAKNWVYLGCAAGFLLWFFGFIVVGGEWFCMWQSEKWNGIGAAFRFVVLIMLTLLFTAMPEFEGDQR